MTPLARGGVLLSALGAAIWRAAVVPAGELWRDWVLILAAYAAYTACLRESRHWPAATAGVMAFLLGLYVQGQFPHLLAVLGLGP